MAKDFFSEETFEEMLKVAKQKPVLFAFALGKEKDASAFGLKRMKGGGGDEDEDDEQEGEEDASNEGLDPDTKRLIAKGKKFALLAKKEPGAGTKTAFGEASVTGQLMTLKCYEYVQGMKKALKAKFKKSKKFSSLKFLIVVQPGTEGVDPEDIAAEEVDESAVDAKTPEPVAADVEEEEGAETEEESKVDTPAISLNDVIAQLKQLAPQVVERAKTRPDASPPLVALVNEIKQEIGGKNAESAQDGVDRLREALANVPPLPEAPAAPNPLKQQLLQSLPKITPAVSRALNSPDVDDDVKQQLRELVDQLKLDVKNNNLDEAKSLVAQIVGLVKQHAPAAYAKARLRWEAATTQIHADLSRLRTPFVDEYPEDEDLMSLAAQEIDEKLTQFQGKLSDLLDNAYNAQTPEARQQEHTLAFGEIGSFRQHVSSDELIGILDSDSQGLVDLRESLLAALNDIETHIGG
jgi:hypothetical protein